MKQWYIAIGVAIVYLAISIVLRHGHGPGLSGLVMQCIVSQKAERLMVKPGFFKVTGVSGW